jgi:hypothetical protein
VLSDISYRLAIVFSITGALSFAFAVFYGSQILAFVGLGLVFWGGLFFLINPTRYVEGALLSSTVVSLYQTVDRIMKDRNFSGQAYQIPPYPENAYIPDHLKGLKEMVVFIPTDKNVQTPSIEALAESKFLLKNPGGILFPPPGLGLLKKIEKDFNVNFVQMSVSEVCESMAKYILYNLHLAKGMELDPQGDQINVKISDSIYKDLYDHELGLKSISILGCPIVSALACALAKATGNRVTLEELQALPSVQTVKCVIVRS